MKKLLYIAIVLISLQSVMAQSNMKLELNVDKNPVSTGDRFKLTLSIENPVNGKLDFAVPKDFQQLSGLNQSQNISIVNGRQSISRTYSYYLKPKREGKFKIGPAKVVVGNKSYLSNTISLEVIKGASKKTTKEQSNIFLRSTVSKRNPYVGEKVIVTYKLYSRYPNIDLSDSESPEYDGVWSEQLAPKGGSISSSYESLNGVRYQVYTMKKDLVYPLRSGEIKIPSMYLELMVGGSFFSYGQQVNVKSPPLKLNVIPLPKNSFKKNTGLVGDFSLTSEIDLKNLKANEAIDLIIKLKGNGNIKMLSELPIEFPEDFEVFDPEIDDNIKVSANGIEGSRTYRYVLIPRYSGNYSIPEVIIPYFNLKSKSYKNLRIPQLDFQIAKNEGENGVSTSSRFYEKKAVSSSGATINYIQSSIGTPISSVLFWDTPLLFWFLILIGPITFLILFLLKRKSDNISPKEKRKKKSYEIAVKEIDEIEINNNTGNSLLTVVSDYLFNRFEIEKSQQNKEIIKEILIDKNIKEEDVDYLQSLIEEFEFMQFAPVSMENISNRKNELKEVLKKLNSIQS